MKLLIHTCCAPCSIYCIKTLKNDEIIPTLYWYNPNIHPYIEYKTRKETLQEYAKSIDIDLIVQEEYGLRTFIKKTIGNIDNRCIECYKIRLEQTVKYAKENGFDSFTTTLLVSTYQKHEMIKQIGQELSKQYGLEFIYYDFRQGFRQGQEEAKDLELYRQKYCGCIFSEEERYLKCQGDILFGIVRRT